MITECVTWLNAAAMASILCLSAELLFRLTDGRSLATLAASNRAAYYGKVLDGLIAGALAFAAYLAFFAHLSGAQALPVIAFFMRVLAVVILIALCIGIWKSPPRGRRKKRKAPARKAIRRPLRGTAFPHPA